MVMWDEIAAEVAEDFPDVKCDKMLVDAMTCRSKCAGGADMMGSLSNQVGVDEMALRRPFSLMPDPVRGLARCHSSAFPSLSLPC